MWRLLLLSLCLVSSQVAAYTLPRVFRAKRLLDVRRGTILYESQEGVLASKGTTLSAKHYKPHGQLISARCGPSGSIVSYVVDDCYHTVYHNDEVVLSSSSVIMDFTVTDNLILCATRDGFLSYYSFKHRTTRSNNFAWLHGDVPCTLFYRGGLTYVGTVNGDVQVIDRSRKRTLLTIPAQATSATVSSLYADNNRLLIAYTDGSVYQCYLTLSDNPCVVSRLHSVEEKMCDNCYVVRMTSSIRGRVTLLLCSNGSLLSNDGLYCESIFPPQTVRNALVDEDTLYVQMQQCGSVFTFEL